MILKFFSTALNFLIRLLLVVSFAMPLQSMAQGSLTWTNRAIPASLSGNQWRAITFGNGIFVAVSRTGTSSNRVMTSPDGLTWTEQVSANGNNWRGITFGNNLFVAVADSGTGNRVMTSPDGVSWTARASASDAGWTDVTYGNGLFVAVAAGAVMTSPDGVTWSLRTAANSNAYTAVAYGNGMFVAVATSGTGNRVMTSSDGMNWTARTTPSNINWRGITYGNGLFVAVAGDLGIDDVIMTSPDGNVWTLRTGQVSGQRGGTLGITFGGGMFVAVQSNSGRVLLSQDGISWSRASVPQSSTWYSVAYSNGRFVAVSTDGTYRVMTGEITSVPGAPTIGTATAGNAQASVSFTAPASNGGASITGYTVTSSPGGFSGTGASSPIVVTGLSNGTAYTFTVTATNSVGTGAASSASNSVTPVEPSVAGTCGSANAQIFAFVPAANLCTAGTASVVASANGQYTWSCNGSGGGANASCTANWASTTGNNTGMVSVPSNSNNGWTLDTSSVSFAAAQGANNSPATPPPANYTFPQGVASFNLTSGAAGSDATVVIHYTEAIPLGALYMKYGRTQSSPNTDVWYQLAANRVSFSNDRKSVTLTLTDGGEGDHDRTANSTIVDPGGPAVVTAPTAIPTLGEWAMMLMASLMAFFGYLSLQKRYV